MKRQLFYLFTLLVFIYCSEKATGPDENETETGTIRDIEGNRYQVIKIGKQWWMAENLKVTKYRNGEWIINVTGSASWANISTGAYCYYGNDFNNKAIYGYLYNHFAIEDNRNIAPEGWHVPTDGEWQELINYLGGSALVGGKIQGADSLWYEPIEEASNESGFSALPGGYRSGNDGTFDKVGFDGYWWSSTQNNSTLAWFRSLTDSTNEVIRDLANKKNGFSIRCIRD